MTNQKYNKKNENIDLRAIFNEFLRNWYLFAICILIALGFAFVYNKFAPPVYKVSSSLLISSGDQNNISYRDEFYSGLEISAQSKELQNEIMILKSQPVILNVVKSLDFNVSYYSKSDYLPYKYIGFNRLEKFFLREMYKNSPFEVVIDPAHLQTNNIKINIAILNNTEFSLEAKGEDVDVYDYQSDKVIYSKDDNKDFYISGRFKFGEQIKGSYYSFKVFLKSNYNNEYQDKDLYFSFNNISSLASKFKNSLEILPSDVKATVVDISLENEHVGKSIEFVNGLTQTYLQKDLAKKNYFAISTIEYIDEQIADISDSLSMTENELQSFRKQNQVMDINAKTGRVTQQLRDLENQKNQKQQELKFYQELSNHFEASKDTPNLLAPSSMGVSDPILNSLIQQLIEKNVEKNTLIDRNQQRNPRYRSLTVQIEDLKSSISQNITFFIKSTATALDAINSTISRYRYEEGKLPQTQRELLEITRRFELNDEIYTFLLRKRAEAQIAKASNLPDSEIIEPAQLIGKTYPKSKGNLVLALLVGVFAPAFYLQFRKFLNNKITEVREINQITTIPVIGKIPHEQNPSFVSATDPHSPISDSYRSLRTNLEFYLKEKEKAIILVTSTMGNDGKSFTTLNLATSFAKNNKKTVILGFDLRKPSELFREFGTENVLGLSSYLIGKSNLEELIIKTPINNLDLIHAGGIPPNSLELISSSKTNELIAKLKNIYDFIVIDSAPIGLLPDAFALMKYSDINLMVIRQNFTIKEFFVETINELEQKQVANLYLLFNDEHVYKHELKYKYYYNHS